MAGRGAGVTGFGAAGFGAGAGVAGLGAAGFGAGAGAGFGAAGLGAAGFWGGCVGFFGPPPPGLRSSRFGSEPNGKSEFLRTDIVSSILEIKIASVSQRLF